MTNKILNQLFSSCKKWKTLVLISMLLTLGVGQMWGVSICKTGTTYIYLDRTNMTSWTTSGNTYLVWRYDNSAYRAQTSNIANTKLALWYGSTGWDNITHIGYMYGSWGASGSDTWSNITSWATDYTNSYNGSFGFNSGNYSVVSATGSSKNWTLSPTYMGSTVASMNKTITVKAKVSTDGGSSYSESTSPGTLSASSKKFTTYNSCASATSLSSGTISCGYTATTTLTAADATGYDFVGWYNSSGTRQTTSKTLTIYPTANATYYAYYKAKTTTITLNNQDATTAGSTSVTATYGAAMPAITLPTKTGYIFGGYFGAPQGGGQQFYNSDGSSAATWNNENSTYTLFAKWTAITLSATISPSTINANTATAIQFTITTNAPLSSGYYYEISNWGGKNSGTAGGYNIDGDHLITTSSITHNLAAAKTNLDAGTYKIKIKITKDAVTQVESDLLTLTVSSSTYTVTVNAGAGGTASPASISASPDSWSGDITATPNAGYQFVNWTSSGGGITINGNTANPTQIKATSTGGTLTANFSAATYRVTLDNQSATSAGTPYVDATYNTTTLTTITKPTKSNYTFGGYYTATGGGGIQIIDANGNWLASKSGFTDGSKKSIITENKILYAKWTETMSTLTTSNHYDVGDPSYAAPTVSGSATTVGYVTTRTVTATAAGTGYTFAGWTLTNCTRTDGGAATATTITIRSNGDGAAASAQANYNEDLSSTYYVEGNASGPFTYGWNANENTMMKKRSGSSTSSDVYWELEVPSSKTSPSNTQWEFKIYNDASTTGEKWYGWGNGSDHYWLTKANNNLTLSTTGSNTIYFKCYVEGTYTFHVNYSTPASPTLEVTWPVVNQLRVSAADPTDATNTGNFDLVEGSSNDWSVSRTLNANTTYTFKMVFDGAWYGDGTEFTRSKTSTTSLGDGNDMTIKTDVAGEYTFTFNSNSKNLSITYPTAYTVTYGAGTSYTAMGSVSTDPDIASGAEVSAGTNISFTATPNPGYKFVGWYSNDACTSSLSTDNPYSVTINAATTVYAKFELMDIKINSDVDGLWPTPWTQTIMTHSSGSPAIYTYSTTLLERATGEASAPFNSGYHFNFVDSNNDLLYNFNGVQTPTYSGSSIDGVRKTHDENPTIQFGLTRKSDVTITLTLQTPPTKPTVNIVALPYYTVTLDLDEDHKGTTAGATTSQIVTLNAVTTTVPNRPTGAEGYGLDGYYTDHNGVGTKVINGDGTWIASVPNYTDADKKWIHDGDVTLYAYYKMAEIASITVSPAIVAPRETVSATPVYSPAPNGTTRICWEVQYSNGTPLPSQPAFTTEGSTVSFQAPESSATYRIEAKLYTGSTCGGGTLLSTQYATFQVAGSHTVTVQYMCDNMVIKAATEMTGKPLEWSEEFTAPTITGYTFTRWDAGDGVTIKNGDSDPVTTTTNPTIQIKAVYDGTLTAVYSKRRLIFFYNTLGWENVYVYFYKNNTYWESTGEKRGTGANTTYTWTNTPYSEGLHGQMLPISEGSSIYYFDAEAAGVNASYTTVAFTEANQHGNGYFYETKAARRDDYKSTTMPMFVPLGDQTPVVHNKTNYYNSGYWMNYPENTGYTLKIYNAWNATKETDAVRSIAFPYSADKKMPLKLDVEFNEANHDYWFMVYRNDGTYLGSTYHFKQGYQDEQIITGGNNKNKITTSAPGNYTLTLTYHDNGSGTVNYYIGLNFPIANNDYRIVYNDRVKWSSNTAHTASWYHPSDIIRQIENGATEPKKDTASFFISKAAGANASMKFQKASVTGEGVITWTDVASGTIEIPSSVTESGVYNFIVSQPVGGGSIALEKVEPYTGSYYIRTDCAGSTKWDSYKATDHQMTFSDYTKANEGYTHYYAHWVDRGTNVKFVIANDYSPFVSDTLTKDVDIDFKNMDDGGTLKSDGSSAAFQDKYSANIRFMYSEQTNKLSRAYLASSTDVSKKFLVMRGNSASGKGHIFNEEGKELTGDGQVAGLDEYEMNFADDQNFIYETVIKANPTALVKLYAKYCGISQEFKGDLTPTFDTDHAVEILGGTYAADTKEKMRIVYDFKTNRLVCAWLPSGDITGELDINADVMIIREHQGDAQQIKFTTNESKLDEVKTVYGVMRFNRWTLNNKDKSTHDPVGDPKSQYERALYWISFPFDVNLSDVFGFGSYGEDWIIEYYDGAARAAEGYWIDSPGFWRYVWPAQRASFKLEAGKGYVLALDLDRMKDNNMNFWVNDIEQIELFFPSATEAGSIKETEAIISVAGHECTIDRRTDKTAYDIDKDRTKADSHWNMIGVPSYANYGTSLTSDGSTVVTWNRTPYTQDLPFLYEWNMVDDSYTVQSGTTYPFKSMYAYMVQYHGDLYWSLASATPSSIIARRAYAQAPQEVEFKLELQQNEQMVDQTFVKLSDKEEVSANFNFDEDLCKEFNRGKANIYTIVETYIPVAGNILPLSEQTTLVPVGVKTSADGDYTFSMPNGTDGVGVTLIDGVTGERTNLALTDYTVSLEKGTYDQRFVLEISPIEHTTTAIENSEKTDAPNTVCKKLIDGVLYIIKDGKVFDARGARLQ